MNRTRRFWLATACALAVLSMSPPAHAQRGGGGPGGRGGWGGGSAISQLLDLALDSAVWDEINITDDQLGKVTKLRAQVELQSRTFRDNLRSQQRQQQQQQEQQQQVAGTNVQANDPAAQEAARQARDEARRVAGEAISENSATVQAQTNAKLMTILKKPKQFKRLQEIDLRAELETDGPSVFIRPDVIKTLGLSSGEVAQIQAVIDQMKQGQTQINDNRRQLFGSMRNNNGGGGGGGRRGQNNTTGTTNNSPQAQADQQAQRDQIMAQIQQLGTSASSLKDTSTQKAFKVLSKSQQSKFKGLLGSDFNLAALNYGRGPDNNGPGGFGFGGPAGPGGPGGGNAAPATSTVNNLLGTAGTAGTTKAQTKATTTPGARGTSSKSATNR